MFWSLIISCTPSPVGWDLAQPETVLDLIDHTLSLRRSRDPLAFGVVDGSESCPLAEGDALDVQAGERRWSGACEAGGLRFSGQLSRSWSAEGASWSQTWTGQDWSVEGEGASVQQLSLHGLWTAEGGDDEGGRWLEERAEGSLALLTPDLQGPFVEGVEGSWSLSGSWDDLLDRHLVKATFATERGELELELDLQQHPDGCANGLPDAGVLRVSTETQTAELDLASPGACVGCWDWTLDGRAQADPICRD